MENFKKEFLVHVTNKQILSKIKCVCFSYKEKNNLKLCPNYTQEEYEYFLETLDFNYDDGYGTQEIDGFIWYEDGTFSQRAEYDGSEWFEYMETPEIPDFMILEGEKNLLKKEIEKTPDGQKKKRL